MGYAGLLPALYAQPGRGRRHAQATFQNCDVSANWYPEARQSALFCWTKFHIFSIIEEDLCTWDVCEIGDFTMQYSSPSASAILAGDRASLPGTASLIRTPYVLIVDDDRSIVDVIQSLLEIEAWNSIGLSDSLKVLAFFECAGR